MTTHQLTPAVINDGLLLRRDLCKTRAVIMETENDGYGFLNVPRHGYQDVSVNTVVLFQMFPKDKT